MKQPKAIRNSKLLHFHWTERGGSLVAKRQFKTLDDALAFMDKRHINKDKFNVYVCPDCGMWHIGHRKV